MLSCFKRYYLYIGMVILVGACLSGCSIGPSLTLTEEQSQLVSEYAGGVLVKYQKGHSMGLVNVDELDYDLLYATPTPTPIVTPTPEPTPEPEIPEEINESADSTNGEKSGNSVEWSLLPMNEAFGLAQADLSYNYYELCDTYPNEADELVFSMHASYGKKLLVVHFNLTNNSGQDEEYRTSLKDFRVRGLLNNSEKIRGELTFLTNDLANYSGTLSAGDSDDVVLVYEIPETTDLNSFSLLLIKNGEQLAYSLF